MKLWLDDVRPAPDGWTWAQTAREAVDLINSHGPEIEAVSLDHDLGAPRSAGLYARGTHEENGKVVANHIAGYKQLAPGTTIRIHSWNPGGAQFMAYVLTGSGYKVEVRPFDLSEAS